MPQGKYKHKQHSEETKRKISLEHRCKPRSEKTKLNISLNHSKYWKGKHFSKQHNIKISNAMKGRTPNNIDLLKNYWKGKHHSEETKELLSKQRKGKYKGEKSPGWKGGLSFEPYTVDWTETLKKSIRERDKYICQMCFEKQGDITHNIHHIDYDKKNCNPNNLITLCNTCHSKTNSNREKWIKYFKGDK